MTGERPSQLPGVHLLMRFSDVVAYQKKRLRNPWVWIPMVGLGTVLSIISTVIYISTTNEGILQAALWAIVGGFGISTLYFWLSPAPWLWTRGRASHAPIFRGSLQSLGFNVLFIVLVALVQIAITSGMNKPVKSGITVGGAIATALFIHTPAASLLGFFITSWERTRWVKDETEKKLREAHWVLLRGQLSPHVLFNALNGLAELVRQDPIAAEQAILDLSGLYRALLDHGSRPSAPLGDERKLVDQYLSVEQLRLGKRLSVSWDWDDSVNAIEAPPFLVQPLVENALKHGITPHLAGGELRLSASRSSQTIKLSVANTGKPLPLVLGNGVGVRNLDARLYLAYGDRAKLHLRTAEEWTVAEILIEGPLLKEQL